MCMYASDAKPEFSSSFQTANKSNRSYSQHYVAFHLHSLASSRVDMLRFTFANINWPKYVWFVFYLQFSRRSFADIDQIVVLLLFPVVRLHVIMSGANAFLSIRHWFVPFGQVALTPFNTSPQRHKLNILGVIVWSHLVSHIIDVASKSTFFHRYRWQTLLNTCTSFLLSFLNLIPEKFDYTYVLHSILHVNDTNSMLLSFHGNHIEQNCIDVYYIYRILCLCHIDY